MNMMMVVFNHPDIRYLPSETVWFIQSDAELEKALLQRDVRLGRNSFSGEIPTATKVELYKKNEKGDYVILHTWSSLKSREQAIVDFYRNLDVEVQRTFINSIKED